MFVIKYINKNDDIRRITVERCLPIQDLIDLARSLFRENLPQHFQLKYKDDEGDFVTVSSDRELEEAFRLCKDSGILRLYVTQIEAPMVAAPAQKQEKKPLDAFEDIVNIFTPYVEAVENEIRDAWPKIETQYNTIYPKIEEQLKGFGETALDTLAQVFDSKKEEAKENEVVHPAICDICQERIKGLRWKCVQCPDYDLCSTCKQQNVHDPDHQFLKMEKPLFNGNRCRGPCQRPASAPPTTTLVKEEVQIPLRVVEEAPAQPVPLTPLRMVQKTSEKAEEPKKEEPKKVDEPKKEEPKISAFESKLQQLEEMGFSDRPKNVQLLVKCNGDMVAVVRDLLE